MSIDFQSPQVRIVRTRILGEEIMFATDQPKDAVQSHHVAGRFYEPDELMIMSKVFPVGGRFLDIGANVGNHSLFFAKYMKAEYVLPFEVNPRVIDLLRTNIMINGLGAVCNLDQLGIGLHNENVNDAGIRFRERNIGGARVQLGEGDLQLRKGDDVIDEPFDLVKIDVEGAEINVLEGLTRFIKAYRPHLFVEVEVTNDERFGAWMEKNDYQELERFQRYRTNVNYLIAPSEKIKRA